MCRCSVAARRNRVHPVERVGDVDDPVLLADRGDRLRERHPARDLLLQEEADHLALVVGLHLLARDHDQLPLASELDDLERSAEDVVVGDGDRPEPLGLGVVDERLRLDRAVVRPVRVHVEIDGDPVAVAEEIGVGRRARADGRRRRDGLACRPLSRCSARLSKSAGRPCARAFARPPWPAVHRPRRVAPPQPTPTRAAPRGLPARRPRSRSTAPRAGGVRCHRAPERRSPPRRARPCAPRASRGSARAPDRGASPGLPVDASDGAVRARTISQPGRAGGAAASSSRPRSGRVRARRR